jgi:hypothetical protein
MIKKYINSKDLLKDLKDKKLHNCIFWLDETGTFGQKINLLKRYDFEFIDEFMKNINLYQGQPLINILGCFLAEYKWRFEK